MLLDGRNSNFGISNEKYKFTGKERDDETNYDYFGARYYDSRIGRWLGVIHWLINILDGVAIIIALIINKCY
jgi:hypothetical protein